MQVKMTKALPSGTLQSITDGPGAWQGDPAFKSAPWQTEMIGETESR